MREQWTLYPNGEPKTVMLVSRGIRLPDRRLGLFDGGRFIGRGPT